MPDASYGRHGRSMMKREAAMLEAEAAERQAAVVAANRERLRMDAPAVDPTLFDATTTAVYVRGRGWFYLVRVNAQTATVSGGYGFGKERVPLNQIVDFR